MIVSGHGNYDVLLFPSSQQGADGDDLDGGLGEVPLNFNFDDFGSNQSELLPLGIMATTTSRKSRPEPDSLGSVVDMLKCGTSMAMDPVDENNILESVCNLNYAHNDMHMHMGMGMGTHMSATSPFDGGVEDDDVILHDLSLSMPSTVFASGDHPGNNRLYILISLYRARYLEAYEAGCERKCDEIAEEIVTTICDKCSGRFREYNPFSSAEEDGWVDIGKQEAVNRVKWAMRDPPQVKLSEWNYHGGEECEEEKASCNDEDAVADDDLAKETSTILTRTSHGTGTGERSKYSASARAAVNAIEAKDCKSNDWTNPTAISQTMSVESRSYLDSCVASEVTSMSVVSSARMEADEVSSYTMNKGSSLSKTNETPAQRRPPTGMRRRGVIYSADIQEVKVEETISEIPHQNYKVSKDFMNLVVDIFANQSSSRSSFSNSTRLSPDVCVSDQNAKRLKFSSNESIASTTTSSLGGLRADFGMSLNIDHRKSNLSNLNKERSNAAAKKISHRRKKARDRKRVIAATEVAEFAEVKEIKVVRPDGTTRKLSQFDVLCKIEPRISMMTCNHIGNNRLRLILRINQERFNNPETSLAEKNAIVYSITQQILNSEKSKSFFLYQDRTNGNLWTEMEPERVPLMIKTYLELCARNPSFMSLPSFRETPWMTSLAHMQIMGINDLHNQALRNMKRRRDKRSIPIRDPKKIEELQKRVLKNVNEQELQQLFLI